MFLAHRVQRTHTFQLEMSAAEAFPLFTPRGELAWSPEWQPIFLYPPDGETEEGMVFTTSHDEEETVWSLTELDPKRRYVNYARVTPGSRFGVVEVECRDDRDPDQDTDVGTEMLSGNGRCNVTVTYTYTSLTEAGNVFLEHFTKEHFREMIDSWREMIDRSRLRE